MWKIIQINILLFLFLFFLLQNIFCQLPVAEKIKLPDTKLTNFYQIDEGLYRSEQINANDFTHLDAFGIGEILNLRNRHSDHKKAKSTSLILHRVPMKAHAIKEKDLVEALKIIKDRKGPLVVHCKHGSDRTGAVVAMYRIVFQNVSKEDAIEEMVNGGFGFHRIYKNIIRLITNADIERIREELN